MHRLVNVMYGHVIKIIRLMQTTSKFNVDAT